MQSTDLTTALGFAGIDVHHFAIILARLAIAFALGAVVSYRPWRRLIPPAARSLPPSRETVQAQTLIAVAGALMIAVIGESTARAFGLVGLGAFIRFRSGIKDPRDAAMMFVMIGIGMACGLGNVPIALVSTLFCGAVLAVFEATARTRLRRIRVSVTMDRAREGFPALRSAFRDARVIEMPNSNPDGGRVVMEVALGEHADASSILAMLEDHDVHGVHAVTLEEAKPS